MYSLFILNLAQEQNRPQSIFMLKDKRNTFKDDFTIIHLLPVTVEALKQH